MSWLMTDVMVTLQVGVTAWGPTPTMVMVNTSAQMLGGELISEQRDHMLVVPEPWITCNDG